MRTTWKRKQFVTRGSDPTEVITWSRKFGNLEVDLTDFFGDVTSKISWAGKKLLFTSGAIHPKLNKIANFFFEKLEGSHQEELFNYEDEYGSLADYE